MPNYNSSLEIIRNPFVSPDLPEQAQYVYGSWLIHFVAHLLGVDTAVKFFTLNFLFTASFIGMLYALSRKYFDDIGRNIGFGVLLLLPAVSSSLFWVGMDGLTLLLMTLSILSLLSKKLVWFLVSCALLALQHFEMGSIGLGLLLISLVLKNCRVEAKWVTLALVCMVCTKVLFEYLLALNSVNYYSRLDWVGERFQESFLMFSASFPIILWSGFGSLWLFLLVSGFTARPKAFLVVPLVLALIPVALSFDQTRTFAILTFPLALFWLVSKQKWLVSDSSKLGARNLLVISMIPVAIVWEGVTRSTLLMFDVLLVIDRMLSLGIVPPDPSLWPFHGR